MTVFYFVVRTFIYYLRQNLTVALGVAISTAVLAGALIIGDSVTHSLEEGTSMRLGNTQAAISGKNRIFTSGFADSLETDLGFNCCPMLQMEGSATADGGRLRINRLQVNGVDGRFDRVTAGDSEYGDLSGNEVIISENLAARMNLEVGDFFVLRVKKASVFPLNTPFVSAENTTVSLRVTVKSIAGPIELGRFNIRISQTAPYNVFINLEQLNRTMDLKGRANLVLVSAENMTGKEKTGGDKPIGDQTGGNNTGEDITGNNPLKAELLSAAIRRSWGNEDAGLIINTLPETETIELKSERIFVEPEVVKLIRKSGQDETFILTYFVNAFRFQDRETPYSFVSTLEGIGKDRIRINQWLAHDLGIEKGNTMDMDYFVPGPLRRLEEHTISLVVEEIVPMQGAFADENLAPDLPGLSDAGHCRDWEAGIPIDLDKIRDKDEDYWNRYRGTPKAYISLETAEEIWKNRFGIYTAIRFPGNSTSEERIAGLIKERLDPFDLGITTEMVRDIGFRAAREGVDFGQLFLSLSFFVLLSSIILTTLLFRLNLQVRIGQAGTLTALGYPTRLIRRIFLGEGAIAALVGGIPGIFLAILFTGGVFRMMETLWSDIVRTSILQVSVQPETLITGYIISVAVSWLSILLVLRKNLKDTPVRIQQSPWKIPSPGKSIISKVIAWVCLLSGLTILALRMNDIDPSRNMEFIISGGLILVSLFIFMEMFFRRRAVSATGDISYRRLILKNAGRSRQRRIAIILLFALGTYTVVLTGSNRRDAGGSEEELTSGTGGFRYYAESTIPVLFDLNNAKARREAGIEGGYSFIQFRRNDGDDASCLNLNRVASPVLLGVDPIGLQGRFKFVTGTEDLESTKPWLSLNDVLPGGVVPGIADQTVIQWGLGKKVGDTLIYLDEAGDSLRIKLIGGIAPSVLQGNIVISDQNFLNHFPSSSGASIYLVEPLSGERPGSGEIIEMSAGFDPHTDLTRALRDNGWYMTGSSDRLAEFESVQNTYLSIFALLGVLAILLGTVGLGIVLVRDIMERRNELGLLQSFGFGRRRIFRMLFTEYFVLISAGLVSGYIAGIISTLTQFVSVGVEQIIANLIMIILILLINGVLWIGFFVWFNTRKEYVNVLSMEY